jgi:hypothetical protein
VSLPRIAGSHCDHAAAPALAVYRHDRYGLASCSAASVDGEGLLDRSSLTGIGNAMLAYGSRM